MFIRTEGFQGIRCSGRGLELLNYTQPATGSYVTRQIIQMDRWSESFPPFPPSCFFNKKKLKIMTAKKGGGGAGGWRCCYCCLGCHCLLTWWLKKKHSVKRQRIDDGNDQVGPRGPTRKAAASVGRHEPIAGVGSGLAATYWPALSTNQALWSLVMIPNLMMMTTSLRLGRPHHQLMLRRRPLPIRRNRVGTNEPCTAPAFTCRVPWPPSLMMVRISFWTFFLRLTPSNQ